MSSMGCIFNYCILSKKIPDYLHILYCNSFVCCTQHILYSTVISVIPSSAVLSVQAQRTLAREATTQYTYMLRACFSGTVTLRATPKGGKGRGVQRWAQRTQCAPPLPAPPPPPAHTHLNQSVGEHPLPWWLRNIGEKNVLCAVLRAQRV